MSPDSSHHWKVTKRKTETPTHPPSLCVDATFPKKPSATSKNESGGTPPIFLHAFPLRRASPTRGWLVLYPQLYYRGLCVRCALQCTNETHTALNPFAKMAHEVLDQKRFCSHSSRNRDWSEGGCEGAGSFGSKENMNQQVRMTSRSPKEESS